MKSLTKLSVLFMTIFLLFGTGISDTFATTKINDDKGNVKTTLDSTNIKIENGMTQPIYTTDDAIVENIFVETTVDSDNDGKKDRVSIKIMRPNTGDDIKVPVIYEMSPYRSGLKNVPNHNVDHELTETGMQNKQSTKNLQGKPNAMNKNFGSLANYYVPRGYAVILGESIGSGKSDGCPTVGDEKEVLGTKAVIDWLNGNAKAFTEEGKEVSASWSTGKVGMTGVSYNGTLPNAVATTGVEGLETIVPVAAISSWYDYYRSNGAVVAPGGYQGEDADILAKAVLTRENPETCENAINDITKKQDRETGDYNQFWDDRNYVKDADQIEASVFIVHGLNDWNVKSKQYSQWWEALGENKVPRKMWLHQGGHGGTNANDYKKTENRWFDHWLYEIDNGIMDEPKLDIEREDRTWDQEADWPNIEALNTTLHIGSDSDKGDGSLSLHSAEDLPKATQSLLDDPMKKASELVADPESESVNRLAYLTPELTKEVRISGTPEVKISANIDQPVANLTALLVDYGGDTPEIVTRGWMDPQNQQSDEDSISIIPGQDYTFEWSMQPDDYIFKSGHHIGIVLLASDYEYTIRPSPGTKITVDLENSYLELPIVGGATELSQINASDMKILVNQLQEKNDINNEQASRALKRHLDALGHFEKQDSANKVVKHTNGLKKMLDNQQKKGMISDIAYDILKENANQLIERWKQ